MMDESNRFYAKMEENTAFSVFKGGNVDGLGTM